MKTSVSNGLIGLYSDAVQAISDSLQSKNEAIRLKSAIWLVKQSKELTFGDTDPKLMIEKA